MVMKEEVAIMVEITAAITATIGGIIKYKLLNVKRWNKKKMRSLFPLDYFL